MLEKIKSILPVSRTKPDTQPEKKGPYSAVPQSSELILKGQELLGNSKLGEIMAQKKAKKYIPITFTPAKTIEEAAKFAKEKLGIWEYNVNDLEIANYVNEAISIYKNRTHTSSPIFHRVFFESDKKDRQFAMAAITDTFNTLFIPNDFLNTDNSYLFDEDSADFYKVILDSDIQLTKNQKEMLNKAINNPSDFDIFDQKVLADFVKKACLAGTKSTYRYACTIGDGKAQKYYAAMGKKLPTVEQYSKLSQEEQQKLIDTLKKDGFCLKITETSKFKTVFHEIGHVEHSRRLGIKYYNSIVPSDAAEKQEEYRKMFAASELKHGELSYISDYAQTSPGEFVAETFAAILDGNTISKEIMDVYKKYGGPILRL